MTSEKPEISRVNRSREDARTSYNKMSKWYDTIAKPEKKIH
jgi:hypothetical protein